MRAAEVRLLPRELTCPCPRTACDRSCSNGPKSIDARQRPGRRSAGCSAWLALNGVDRDVGRPLTLAELYAIAEDRELEAPTAEAFGFARALTR